MIKFSRNNLKYQIVRSPLEHTANGNVHTDILLLGIIALEHSFKTIFGGFNSAFWWFGVLSEDREHFLTNPPKLSCGFNAKLSLKHTINNSGKLIKNQLYHTQMLVHRAILPNIGHDHKSLKISIYVAQFLHLIHCTLAYLTWLRSGHSEHTDFTTKLIRQLWIVKDVLLYTPYISRGFYFLWISRVGCYSRI